jgi:hypothetical protein
LFKEYTTLAGKSGGSAGVKKWVENLGKGDQHALQVFQCATDLRFFTILNMFGNAFHNKPVFSVKYVRQHLHGLCGGVGFFLRTVGTLLMKPLQIIVEVLEIMAKTTRGIFSLIPNFDINEDTMARHISVVENLVGKLADGEQRPSKAERDYAANLTIRAWKSILQASPETSELQSLYLTPLPGRADKQTLMECVDELFRGIDLGKNKEFFMAQTKDWYGPINEYLEEVKNVIFEEIVQGVVPKGRASEVAETVASRFGWVSYDHGELYRHGQLPLFSPSVVTSTIQLFNGIGEGLTEVRIS